MYKILIVIVGIIIIAGVVYFLTKGSTTNPQTIKINNTPFGSAPTDSTGPSNSVNSVNTLPETTAPQGTTIKPPTGTSQDTSQTADKKQATTLINQTNASAGEFDTMNNSANQLDQNTSL